MNLGLRGFLVAIAVVATGIAVWAGDNFSLAAPAAPVAVLAAGLLLTEAVVGRAPAATPAEASVGPSEVGTVRTAFRSGRLGREALADLLDRLERAGPNPDLPSRRAEETRRLLALPYAEFRSYLRQRLEYLESWS